MTIQSYFYLIASSLASGLIAFTYYAPEQVINNETTLTSRFPANKINQECVEITLNQMSALGVQPELILNWGLPKRLVSAASR